MIEHMNRKGLRIGWLAACTLWVGAMASVGFCQ